MRSRLQVRARSLTLFLALLLVLAAWCQRAQCWPRASNASTSRPAPRRSTSSGNLDNGAAKQYVLRASAGQSMTISAAWVAYPYQVSVISPSSQLLGVADAGASWSGTLPATGDYMLIVQPGVSGARVYYNFVLSITGSTAPTATPRPTTTPPNVQRINFAPGATSATVYGTLYPNQQQQYVLRALAGQSMTAVTSSTGPFRLVISGADGTSLGTINANQSLTVYLPTHTGLLPGVSADQRSSRQLHAAGDGCRQRPAAHADTRKAAPDPAHHLCAGCSLGHRIGLCRRQPPCVLRAARHGRPGHDGADLWQRSLQRHADGRRRHLPRARPTARARSTPACRARKTTTSPSACRVVRRRSTSAWS